MGGATGAFVGCTNVVGIVVGIVVGAFVIGTLVGMVVGVAVADMGALVAGAIVIGEDDDEGAIVTDTGAVVTGAIVTGEAVAGAIVAGLFFVFDPSFCFLLLTILTIVFFFITLGSFFFSPFKVRRSPFGSALIVEKSPNNNNTMKDATRFMFLFLFSSLPFVVL